MIKKIAQEDWYSDIVFEEERLFTEINDLILIMKLTGHTMKFRKEGTRSVTLIFSDNSEKIKIEINKDSRRQIISIDAVFYTVSKKDKIKEMFAKDMEVRTVVFSKGVQAYTYIYDGFYKIIKKAKWV